MTLQSNSQENFDKNRLTGAVVLDVAKAFDTLRAEGLLYKLTILSSPPYLTKTTYSYLHPGRFQTTLQ
jgi:hypothetical protein